MILWMRNHGLLMISMRKWFNPLVLYFVYLLSHTRAEYLFNPFPPIQALRIE